EAHVFLGGSSGWGFGVGVSVRRNDLAGVPGRFGWDGSTGTSAYSDPKEDLIGLLLTQRLMDNPGPPNALLDFWTSAYQAIDD
ncbi:serine hydrolase, partial [Paenibacillus sepulcri]|nr:serine hydrolase [Paenibacillus sepulcri]